MTKEEFLREIESLDDDYFQKRWEQHIKDFGKEHAVKNYQNMYGLKNHILNNYKKNKSFHVEQDCDLIREYYDVLNRIGEEEFVNSFGETRLFLLKTAIERQREGLFAYIQKI